VTETRNPRGSRGASAGGDGQDIMITPLDTRLGHLIKRAEHSLLAGGLERRLADAFSDAERGQLWDLLERAIGVLTP
jgi:hypothetical protein